ncbi:MAG: MATE family efflux transporter [Lachnospiraceae bacterium]|jgi:putative MATE family efflux protein
MKKDTITEGRILPALLKFALPFLAAYILQSLYGAVDLWVVGKFSGAAAVAAVSTGTQVTQIVTSLVTGLTTGSTVLIGEYAGAGKGDKVKRTIGTTLTVFAVVAVIISILMIVFEKPLLTVLRTPEESFELTALYVTICAAGNIFVCGYNAISAVLRGCGDSRRPMYFVGIACGINVVLDIIFVRYLGMGVAGTAFATIISQGFSMFFAAFYLRKKDFIFDFRWKSFIPDKRIAGRLAGIGVPLSLQEIMVRISFLYVTLVMNSAGLYAAGVVGIGAKYDIFAMLAGNALAGSLAAFTAQNYGAHKLDRAGKALLYSLVFDLIVSMAFFAWAQLSPETMIGVFSHDENIIAAGIPYFLTASFDWPVVTSLFILNGYLNGRQKTVWTMVSVCFGALALRIPMTWYVGHHYPQDIGTLGKVAPTVSAVMLFYTLIYVIIIICRDRRKEVEKA